MQATTTTIKDSFRARVTREHRAAVAIIIDSSASMQSQVMHDGQPLSKSEMAVLSANSTLKELLYKSKTNDEVRDYYDVMILIYSGNGVYSLFEDKKRKTHFKSIVEIAKMGDSETLLKLDVLTPFNSDDEKLRNSKFVLKPKGETPMYEVLLFAHDELKMWCEKPENRASTPPMVVNMTDGHPTDGSLSDIIEISERIKNLSTRDGNAMLVNIFISDATQTIIFPTEEQIKELPNEYYRAMALSASTLPPIFEPLAHHLRGDDVADRSPDGYRAIGLAISLNDIISMTNIGTLVTTK